MTKELVLSTILLVVFSSSEVKLTSTMVIQLIISYGLSKPRRKVLRLLPNSKSNIQLLKEKQLIKSLPRRPTQILMPLSLHSLLNTKKMLVLKTKLLEEDISTVSASDNSKLS